MQESFDIRLVDRRRLYQQVASDIERLILDGIFPPDTRLPSEQELAERYGVSRNVIREALKTLKEVGLVSIHTGSGTYVRRLTMKPVTEALNRFVRYNLTDVSIEHFYEIRRMIEPNSAMLAAENATEADLHKIQTALNEMEQHRHDKDAWSRADLDFHCAIAEATQNPLIKHILDVLIEPMRAVIAAGHADPLGPQAGLEAHTRIATAIQARDGQTAFQAMLNHLSDSESRLAEKSS